jgi:hypothetical protein
MNRRVQIACAAAAWIAAIGSPALGQDASLQQKLDKPATISLTDKPIGETFAALSQRTGVAFEIDPDTLAALPYGDQTRLDVSLKAISLRSALPAMLTPQGMEWEIVEQTVRILPSEALYRMGRRATYEELKLLGALMTASMKDISRSSPLAALQQTTKQKELQLILPAAWSQEQSDGLHRRFQETRADTPAEWLDLSCRPDLTWYLDRGRIVVLPRAEQGRRQLERKATLRYQNAPLMSVLLDLVRQAHLKLLPEPGVIQSIPTAMQKNFTLVMADATIDQALQIISGTTGLKFEVTADGVAVKKSNLPEISTGDDAAPAGPGVFVQTTIQTSDGRELRVFLVPDQMSEGLRKALEAERRRIVEELEKHYAAPPEKPADE